MDEFGAVARDVYEAAGRLWPQSLAYAARALPGADEARVRTLLVKAASQVTRARDEKEHPVHELDGYLFQSFKRVVLAELEKDNNRRRFEAEAQLDAEWRGQASNVERRILLDELVGAMDDWTRGVFQWVTLDYSFEEIARHLGMNAKVLRTKYGRRLNALMKQVSGEREKKSSAR